MLEGNFSWKLVASTWGFALNKFYKFPMENADVKIYHEGGFLILGFWKSTSYGVGQHENFPQLKSAKNT
ncbi:MAG: hypothetical protein FWG65_00260 [Turicibacter sp.]|nr:hypothetical protein [Turicibacter sp.]